MFHLVRNAAAFNAAELFDAPFTSFARRVSAPRIDIEVVELPEAYAVKAFVPGARKEDLKVRIEEGSVVHIELTRETKEGEGEAGARMLYADRLQRSSGRSFSLPEELADAGHSAKLENGVLELKVLKRLPKRAAMLEVQVQ